MDDFEKRITQGMNDKKFSDRFRQGLENALLIYQETKPERDAAIARQARDEGRRSILDVINGWDLSSWQRSQITRKLEQLSSDAGKSFSSEEENLGKEGKLKSAKLLRCEDLSPEVRKQYGLPDRGLAVHEVREVPPAPEASEITDSDRAAVSARFGKKAGELLYSSAPSKDEFGEWLEECAKDPNDYIPPRQALARYKECKNKSPVWSPALEAEAAKREGVQENVLEGIMIEKARVLSCAHGIEEIDAAQKTYKIISNEYKLLRSKSAERLGKLPGAKEKR